MNYLLSKQNLNMSDNKRHNKIMNFVSEYPLLRTNRHCVSNYNTIYATSDIHSDFRKFIQALIKFNLIIIPKNIDIFTDDIYNTLLITDTKWNNKKKKVLVVIVGDLIDGKRPDGNDLNDEVGSFEFLLHAFIYNMRIKALHCDSHIVFTIGNHDHHNIIINDIVLQNYTRPSAINYFGDVLKRREILIPFYECNPFYDLVLLNKDDTKNTIFVHGGLHSNKAKMVNFDIVQNFILENIGCFIDIEQQLKKMLINAFSNSRSAIWTRYYADNTDSCSIIEKDLTNTLVVIGHCPTDNNCKHISKIMENDIRYDMCNKEHGCVVTGCNRKSDNGPNLVFVDSALSSIFHSNDNDERRVIEFLKLTHIPSKKDKNRYYNKIERIESPTKICHLMFKNV